MRKKYLIEYGNGGNASAGSKVSQLFKGAAQTVGNVIKTTKDIVELSKKSPEEWAQEAKDRKKFKQGCEVKPYEDGFIVVAKADGTPAVDYSDNAIFFKTKLDANKFITEIRRMGTFGDRFGKDPNKNYEVSQRDRRTGDVRKDYAFKKVGNNLQMIDRASGKVAGNAVLNAKGEYEFKEKYMRKNFLSEAYFRPLSEMSSFTGWDDDDKLIDEEERFYDKLERILKKNRDDIQVLIDEDFQYDPRTYELPNLEELQEVKTRNIRARKFRINGIEFVFEESGTSSSPRLYFKSEEDGEAYTDYIDHLYD